MKKEEIYKKYPNLEGLSLLELLVMRKELRKYPEDKVMCDAVGELIVLLS